MAPSLNQATDGQPEIGDNSDWTKCQCLRTAPVRSKCHPIAFGFIKGTTAHSQLRHMIILSIDTFLDDIPPRKLNVQSSSYSTHQFVNTQVSEWLWFDQRHDVFSATSIPSAHLDPRWPICQIDAWSSPGPCQHPSDGDRRQHEVKRR